MAPSSSMMSHKGPTVATLKAIEDVLRREAMPMTRYRIRQALGHRIGQPLLDEGLHYLADHEMVYDEGPGGKSSGSAPPTRRVLGSAARRRSAWPNQSFSASNTPRRPLPFLRSGAGWRRRELKPRNARRRPSSRASRRSRHVRGRTL